MEQKQISTSLIPRGYRRAPGSASDTLRRMAAFAYEHSPHPVRPEITQAHRAFWDHLADPGSWWTGEQRVAIAAEARSARPLRTKPPWLRELPTPEDGVIPALATEAVRTIALDAQKIDLAWAERVISGLGDAAYIELVAIVVQTTAVDSFAESLGALREPLPTPKPGEPDRARPDGLGDIGAFVPCLLALERPNVARALSLAPNDNATFFGLVASMYSMADFEDLVWKDRPLSRPQVELVAARVSAINECFY